MRTIPVWRGEFGLKIRYWVPQVHEICQKQKCIVEIESGEEALFPAAHRWQVVERANDGDRYGRPPDLGVAGERFVPEPHTSNLPDRMIADAEVVVCPRWRDYGSQKNWPVWGALVWRLTHSGISVAAAGAPDSSTPVPCPVAWEHDRFLDVSIALMHSARLVVATDAGLAHLAVLCGSDLLLVTHEGRVAPGPVIDSSGKIAQKQYWPVRLEEYYEAANHQNARIETVDGWYDVNRVVEAVKTW